MGKLKHKHTVQEDVSISVETDPYICISLTIEHSKISDHPPLYWRLLDDTFNLIEICVDRVTGLLLSAQVSLYNGKFFQVEEEKWRSESVKQFVGLPQFYLDLWTEDALLYDYSNNNDFHDVQGRAKIDVCDDKLRLWLFPNENISYSIIASNILGCAFNTKDGLCALTIYQLDTEDIATLESYARRHGGLASDS